MSFVLTWFLVSLVLMSPPSPTTPSCCSWSIVCRTFGWKATLLGFYSCLSAKCLVFHLHVHRNPQSCCFFILLMQIHLSYSCLPLQHWPAAERKEARQLTWLQGFSESKILIVSILNLKSQRCRSIHCSTAGLLQKERKPGSCGWFQNWLPGFSESFLPSNTFTFAGI